MKRFFTCVLFVMPYLLTNAQLNVGPTGNVGIGSLATNPLSKLSINTNGDSDYTSYIVGPQYVLSCRRKNINPNGVGIAVEGIADMNGTYWGIGMRGTAHTANATNQGASFGLWGIAGNAANGWNYGVFGQIKGAQNGAAIFGTAYQNESAIYMSNRYAGYFHGPVIVDGTLSISNTLNGILLTPTVDPSVSFSDIATSGQNTEVAISRQLSALTVHTFYTEKPQPQLCQVLPEDGTNGTFEIVSLENTLSHMGKQVVSKRHYGLDAEQLKGEFPDLVYENEDGTTSINYVEMVPLLVQAINELKAEIEDLRAGDYKGTKKAAQLCSDSDSAEKLLLLSLGQNKPNPFSNATTIEVCVPEDVQKAFIYVYDLQGKKVEQVDITGRGKQNIQITSANLTDGMYLYSLIADGKVVETRRLMVEK